MKHSSSKGHPPNIANAIINQRILFFGKCQADNCNSPSISKKIGLCSKHLNGNKCEVSPKRPALKGALVSFIYLIENPEIGAQKIGVTNNPYQRIAHFMRKGFIPLELRVGDPSVISKIENEILVCIYKNKWNSGLNIGKDFGGYTECWNTYAFRASKILDICDVENTAPVFFSISGE